MGSGSGGSSGSGGIAPGPDAGSGGQSIGTGGRGTGGTAAPGSGGSTGSGGGTAVGPYRVTVTLDGGGPGSVISSPAGIDCPATTCTAMFTTSKVTLRSRLTNGSNQRFAGWTGGGCALGVVRDCPMTLSGDTTVKAAFAAVNDNLAFLTAQMTIPSNLGSPGAYDARCNTIATAAGINNAPGDAFVALLSGSQSQAAARLADARGWVRLDGRPFLDTMAAAFADRKVFNAIQINEAGFTVNSTTLAMTGMVGDGSLDTLGTCADWTGAGSVSGGRPDLGPVGWISVGRTGCAGWSLLCLGRTHSTTVAPTVTSGRRIWVTEKAYAIGGGQTPDATCQADRPAGVTTAVALIATATRAASEIVAATSNYVRVDGTLVGTGAQIAAGALESGIWQHASGTYLEGITSVHAGSPAPDMPGTAESTCSGWTSNAMTDKHSYGFANSVVAFWAGATGNGCETTSARLYCVQTAP